MKPNWPDVPYVPLNPEDLANFANPKPSPPCQVEKWVQRVLAGKRSQNPYRKDKKNECLKK